MERPAKSFDQTIPPNLPHRGVEVLPGYRVNEITKKEIKMRKKTGEEQ